MGIMGQNHKSIVVVGSIACLCLPLLATLTDVPLMVATLFVYGASMGALGCVTNIQAIIVERASGKTMMSGFHGLFSCGGILGAESSSPAWYCGRKRLGPRSPRRLVTL